MITLASRTGRACQRRAELGLGEEEGLWGWGGYFAHLFSVAKPRSHRSCGEESGFEGYGQFLLDACGQLAMSKVYLPTYLPTYVYIYIYIYIYIYMYSYTIQSMYIYIYIYTHNHRPRSDSSRFEGCGTFGSSGMWCLRRTGLNNS